MNDNIDMTLPHPTHINGEAVISIGRSGYMIHTDTYHWYDVANGACYRLDPMNLTGMGIRLGDGNEKPITVIVPGMDLFS